MELRAYFKHMDSSLALYAYAEQKIGERLKKYAFNVVEAHITFAVDSGLNRASCHIVAGHGVTMAIESDDPSSMYAAIDRLVDKLDCRLRRKKEKSRSHRLRAPIDLHPLKSVMATPKVEEAIDAAEIISYEKARAAVGR